MARSGAPDHSHGALRAPGIRSARLLFAVILAGGRGSRLWPAGSDRLPKQFVALDGRGSLLQQTARRMRRHVPWERLVVVTTKQHGREVVRQLPNLPGKNVLSEPFGRGTAASLIYAAASIRKLSPEAVMLVAPSDHRIRGASAFDRSLRRAVFAARSTSAMVLLGVAPSGSRTEYGYIRTGLPCSDVPGSPETIRQFIEKPGSRNAARYIRSGEYLWNTGILAAGVISFLEHAANLLPSTTGSVCEAVREGTVSQVRRAYENIAEVSVDLAILEGLSRGAASPNRLLVVRGEFEWNDVGSWDSAMIAWPRDANHNVAVARRFIGVDTTDCVVYAPGHTVATIGVRDLIVVSRGNSLLVCSKERAQDVGLVPGEIDAPRCPPNLTESRRTRRRSSS